MSSDGLAERDGSADLAYEREWLLAELLGVANVAADDRVEPELILGVRVLCELDPQACVVRVSAKRGRTSAGSLLRLEGDLPSNSILGLDDRRVDDVNIQHLLCIAHEVSPDSTGKSMRCAPPGFRGPGVVEKPSF